MRRSSAARRELLPAATPLGRAGSCRWWPARGRSARHARAAGAGAASACRAPRSPPTSPRCAGRSGSPSSGRRRASGSGRGRAAGRSSSSTRSRRSPGWSESVKRLWDEDTRAPHAAQGRAARLGAAARRARALRESRRPLRGRCTCRTGRSARCARRSAGPLEHYIAYGGYPGAAPLVDEPERWTRYIRDSLIETTIARDVLLLTRVDKPALLRRLFELGCRYSGQVLSYTKMLGQLQDAGNTTTLAHYLDLLAGGRAC